ncbi:class F sortase [Humibacter ginsengisoli]
MVAVALVAAAIILVAGAVGVVATRAVPASGPVDLKGNVVQLDPGDTPAPQVLQRMHAVTNTGSRFVVPSVGLDVPLGSLDVVDGEITPPGFTSAYRVDNLGVPLSRAGTGSVFVVMHSLRNGGVGPGNYLIDVDAETSRVRPGAVIRVGGLTYTVTGSKALKKSTVPADSSLWANTPGRLVVFTCLQVPAQTESVDNLVVFAKLDVGASR